jgi:hypothetical protein
MFYPGGFLKKKTAKNPTDNHFNPLLVTLASSLCADFSSTFSKILDLALLAWTRVQDTSREGRGEGAKPSGRAPNRTPFAFALFGPSHQSLLRGAERVPTAAHGLVTAEAGKAAADTRSRRM